MTLMRLMLVLSLMLATVHAESVTVTGTGSTFIIHQNVGFDDPTHGADRAAVFQAAAQLWANQLISNVPIEVDAQFTSLSCTASQATLGSAGPTFNYYLPSGADAYGMQNNTWYPVALYNALTDSDVDPDGADITAQFNADLDDNENCLNGVNWYYGLDHNPPGNDIDFFEVVMHELAHGLGFLSLVDSSGTEAAGLDDSFSLYLRDQSTGKLWSDMTDAERLASMTDTGDLVWNGDDVNALISGLSSGVNGGMVQMYAPASYESGSSVSHFDTALDPDELMEPSYTGGASDDHTRALMRDIGWLTVSQPPQITAQTGLSTAEDTSRLMTLSDFTVADPDSPAEDMTLVVYDGDNYSVSGNTVIPEADFNGVLQLGIRVSDGQNLSDEFTAALTVEAVNDAPVLSGSPQTSATVAETYTASFSATDPDSADLTYAVSGDHNWLSIDASGQLTGTPTVNDMGDGQVNVTVSDGSLTDTISYTLTVLDADSAQVSLTAQVAAPLVAVNDAATVTLTIQNQGPASVASGVVSIRVTAPTIFTAMDETCSSYSAQEIRCTYSDVSTLTSLTFSISSNSDISQALYVSASSTEEELAAAKVEIVGTVIVAEAITEPVAALSFDSQWQTVDAWAEVNSGTVDLVLINDGDDDVRFSVDRSALTEAETHRYVDTLDADAATGGDLDQNGRNEVLFAVDGANRLYRNDATALPETQASAQSRDSVIADINIDGYPDLIVANNGADRIYLNDQSGGLALSQSLGTADSYAVAVFDANADDWPDLLVVHQNQSDRLYLNLGDGTGMLDTTGIQVGASGTDSYDVAAMDIDGDGIAGEWAIGRRAQNNVPGISLYRFTEGAVTLIDDLEVGAVVSVAAANTDATAEDELLLVNDQGVVQLWSFAGDNPQRLQIFAQAGATSVHLNPFDSDSQADLLVTSASGQPSAIYLSAPAQATTSDDTATEEEAQPTHSSTTTSTSAVKSGTFGSVAMLLSLLLLLLKRRR